MYCMRTLSSNHSNRCVVWEHCHLTILTVVLYENIDQILPNKLHGPMHYTNRFYMCIQRTRVLYSVVITWKSYPTISQLKGPCNEVTNVWSMIVYNSNIRVISVLFGRPSSVRRRRTHTNEALEIHVHTRFYTY